MLHNGDTFEHGGINFRVTIEHDPDAGNPWDNDCGVGIVSEWARREKRPGEAILCSDRGSKRFYDIQASMKKARADGWNAEPYTGTVGECAARAVARDFERLRAWFNDQWRYVYVMVETLDDEGDAIDSASLCGIESDADDYIEETANELAAELLANLPDTLRARADSLRAKLDKVTGQLSTIEGA